MYVSTDTLLLEQRVRLTGKEGIINMTLLDKSILSLIKLIYTVIVVDYPPV